MASDEAAIECGKAAVEELRLTITATGAGGSTEDFSLRLFLATGRGIGDFVRKLIADLAAEDEESAAWLVTLLRLRGREREVDRRRTRSFDIRSLECSKELQQLVKFAGVRELSAGEQLVRIAGGPAIAGDALLAEAIYERPSIQLEIDAEGYEEFRDQFLGELCWVHGEMAHLQDQVVAEARRELEAKADLTEEERQRALEDFDAAVAKALSETLADVAETLERQLFKAAMADEERHSARFAPIVAASRSLLDGVLRTAEARGVAYGEAEEGELAGLIQEQLDLPAANEVLWRAILRYEEVFGVEAARDVELVEVPEDWEATAATDDLEWSAGDDPEAIRQEQYWSLWAAYKSDDALEKWDLLAWIATQLVNRNEQLRLVVREAEATYHAVVEGYFKSIYRQIRGRLSRAERRAFALLYFRLPALGYRIAALDPVLVGFWMGMDEETQALLVVGLLFGVREWHGVNVLEELERRWQAYLRLYPAWVAMTKDEERAQKQRRAWEQRKSSQDPSQLGEGQHPGDEQDEDRRVAAWARRYCSGARARSVIRRFVDDWTQEQIAAAEGISQQAVSKRIEVALEEIRRGLEREGVAAARE